MEDIQSLPPDFVKTLSRHVKMIKFYGVNIFESEQSNFWKKYRRLLFSISFMLPTFIGQILFIVWNHKTGASFLDVVNAIPSTLMVLQDFVKIFITASKRDQIRKLILEIGEEWPVDVKDDDKKTEFDVWKQRISAYNKAYFTCAVVSVTIFMLLPLVVTTYLLSSDPNTPYDFPVQVYFYCSLTSHFQYVVTYVYTMITCTLIHICIYVSCDLLLVCLTFDICMLLSLLHNDLRDLVPDTDGPIVHLDDDCEGIRKIVITHQKLLRLASNLNDIFGAVVFTQVSFSAVIICCFVFLAVIANGMLARNLTAAGSMVFALFILTWPGQLLVDTSSSIADAAYDCQWYKKGVKFRRYIAIILTRSQKPCYLTGLGFSELSLAMFSKVLSTAWSYLSLLNQMYAETES